MGKRVRENNGSATKTACQSQPNRVRMNPVKECSAASAHTGKLLVDLNDLDPDLRLRPLVANLATLAQGAKVQAIWDDEDKELVVAAKWLLEHYRQRKAGVA